MDLNRPLPSLPHPSDFDLTGGDDYHRQRHYTPPSRPRDIFDYADDDFVPAPPPSAMAKFGRRLARRIERSCCLCATYFPLAFVYSLTIWALYVVVNLAMTPTDAANASWVGPWCAVVAAVLEVLLLWSYTTAVFSSPGSTTNDQGYSTIPANLSGSGSGASSLTVKSNGEMRFCKKCQARKPDRAHHCSSCRRCVLKMDHHCPWLANCIGLRNGKAFLLFLVYATIFSIFSFVVCGAWVWTEIVNEATYTTVDESFMPVQYIMLCVIGGIIGLVVGLFTGWHLFLACSGQTTIECMEKTRYSSPLRSTMTFTAAATVAEAINDSLGTNKKAKPVHDEERALFDGIEGAHDDGDDDDDVPLGGRLGPNSNGSYGNGNGSGNGSGNGASYNHNSGSGAASTMGRRLTYNDLERYRAQKRHDEYMDEQDSQKLPHAFDLGLRRNLRHMFGTNIWLWPFPILTTTGDGWTWEPSPKWLAARNRIKQERDAQLARERAAGWGAVGDELQDANSPPPPIIVTTATPPRPRPQSSFSQQNQQNQQPSRTQPNRYHRPGASSGPAASSKADRILGRTPGQYTDVHGQGQGQRGQQPLNGNNVSLQRLNAAGRTVPNDDDLFVDDEEEEEEDDDEQTKPPAENDKEQRSRAASPSPLRARWMPDPTSGLLRKASSSSIRSPAQTSSPVHSPTAESPSARRAQPAESVVSDADDGSVD
ncbi:palmitoyltransferase pfa3 [Ophiostoma piceae UAMH 11346]|uniref:Palmitoyltransferase n=1 Tax=Ophiostoma piceae (strain UAMH 11346) TaxID=1262450 RepID=S3CD92_OPHP1|nr:palmitoyltransferase pfa3 [Ophiostoma piceae UAMH 11346]